MFEEVEAPPVIQEIEHEEEGAVRDEGLAALHLEHKLSDNVVQLQQNLPEPLTDTERIYLLEYTRHPEAFRQALAEGALLQQCRDALEGAGYKWLLGSGAKVFVHPCQYTHTALAIVQDGVHLRPYHVVVCESLLYQVEASLADLPYRQGARVRRQKVLANAEVLVPEEPDEVMSADEEPEGGTEDANDIPLVVSKTFLCVAPCRRNQDSVTQSTTEVHGGGLNPRRVLVPSTPSSSGWR